MLVHGRSLRHGEQGRRSRSGERSRPCGKGWHEHLRSGWPVAQRGMRPDRIEVPSPALDDDLSLPQGVEDLPIQQLVPEATSVTSIERIASATGVPCATRTSTWRSLEMISSGVCLFLRIVILLRLKSHTSGWTTPKGADHIQAVLARALSRMPERSTNE